MTGIGNVMCWSEYADGKTKHETYD